MGNINDLFKRDQIKEGCLRIPFFGQQYKLVNNLKDLDINLNANDAYFFYSEKSFNAFTFVLYLLDEFKVLDEIIVYTYSISKKLLDTIDHLLSNKFVGSFKLLISDSIRHRMPAIYRMFKDLSKKHLTFKYELKWSHAKVSLVRVSERYFVIEGSGNCSMNAGIEQYMFVESKDLFHFRQQM